MENIISTLLIICIASFFYGMLKLKKLLATGEVNSFNIMSAKNLSPTGETIKKHALIGFSVFILSILIMLIVTGIYGPIKG